MPKQAAEPERDEARLLLALRSGPMRVAAVAPDKLSLMREGEQAMTVAVAAVASAASQRLVIRSGDRIGLSPEGHARAARLATPDDPFSAQHRDMDRISVEVDGEIQLADINLAESPLAQLVRRKTRDGASFLTRREFDAGERLRTDYTRAQIMPRLSANWDSAISTGKRGSVSNDLSDGAIAARIRVERAIDAVGPELSGVLIDVCCFLKGLERVETERGWPVRSAKVMLKSALGSLARHYDPPAANSGRKMLSWGATGYRPTIS